MFFSFIKNHIILTAFVGIIVVLITLTVLTSPKSQPTTQNQLPSPYAASAPLPLPSIIPLPRISAQNSSVTTATIRLAFPTISLPTSIPVYKTQYSLTEAFAKKLATSLGFSDNPSINDASTYIWQDSNQNKSLVATLLDGLITYTNTTSLEKPDPASPPLTTIANAEEAEAMAKKFLSDHGLLFTNITTNTSNVFSYTGASDQDSELTSNFSNATVYEVRFYQRVNNQTVYEQYGYPAGISVWINPVKVVKKVSFQVPQVLQDNKNFPALSFDEMEQQLYQKKGIVVALGGKDEFLNQELTGKEMTLNTISLAYFNDRQTMILEPIFVFSGTIILNSGDQKPVTVYLPAVKLQ